MQRARVGMALMLLAFSPAHSRIVTLSFDGTYDTAEGSVFGQTGAAVPYSFQITYDTALDTNTEFFGAGVQLGDDLTIHEWYGYSASGVIATSLTFGTQTWTGGGLNAQSLLSGVSAELWFDTDLNSGSPSLSWISFSAPDGVLQLGDATGGGEVYMRPGYSQVLDDNEGSAGQSSNMLITSDIDVDEDGFVEHEDNCTLVANASQCDSDGDDYGNHCDGDFNNNTFTNAQDYILFRAQLGQPSVAPTYNQADLNCNDFVNAQDYILFRQRLGLPSGPSGLVP